MNNVFNGILLDDLFSNVVYNSEELPVIPSRKRFKTLQAQIDTNLLNQNRIASYFTKNTVQELHLSKFCANTFFRNLHIGGLFNFLNVTDLDQNAIKLSGEQYTEASLIFEGFGGLPVDGWANELQVLKTINEIDVNGFVATNENIVIDGDVYVDSLQAYNIQLNGELLCKNRPLVGWNLHELLTLAFDVQKSQTLLAPYYINMAVIKKITGVNSINGFNVPDILDRLRQQKNKNDLLNGDQVFVDRMYVNGSVFVDYINNYHIDTIESNAIYLNRPAYLYSDLRFLDEIVVNGNLTTNYLNDYNFDQFVRGVVSRNDDYVIVRGTTEFSEDIHITGHIRPKITNGLDTDLILTKNFVGVINHRVQINGDIKVGHLICYGYLNSIDCNKLAELYRFDYANMQHILNGDVHFDTSIATNNLYLGAGFNEVANISQYLYEVVRKDVPANIKGHKHFAGHIHFDSNIALLEHNGVDLSRFFERLLLVNQPNLITFNSEVHFIEPVFVSSIKIEQNVVLHEKSIFDFDDWIENGISVVEPLEFIGKLIFGDGVLGTSKGGLNVLSLNGINAQNILTLHTAQSFAGDTFLGEVNSLQPIFVDGHVNSVNLKDEWANTLMVIYFLIF